MVADPLNTINNILSNYPNKGQLIKEPTPSKPSRKHRHKFTQNDINYIEKYTRENAEILGVWDK